MKKLILSIILSLFSILAQAEIQAHVEPSQVSQGQTFKLFLTQNNAQNNEAPDLRPLQKEYVIFGTEHNMSYALINGHPQTLNQWIISLKAKQTGLLTIPAISIGAEQSNPILINVAAGAKTPGAGKALSQAQDVILTTEVSESKPFVNQQIIYTVRLSTSKHLLDADYQGPQVEDALLIPLGGEKRYQTVQNNISYLVEEQSYAIFPQKSGTLKIKPPVFTAVVYDLDPQHIKTSNKAINLTVQPAAQSYKGKTWLPAKKIQLSEHYENLSQTMSQGSTLTRTIIVEGTAVPAQLLPTLRFEDTEAFNVYVEKGKDTNQVKQNALVGSTSIKVTYLFNKTGKIIIPELRVPWFNTETAKEEVAVLAPRSIEISPASTGAIAPKETINPPPSSVAGGMPLAKSYLFWKRLALCFATIWIITLALWAWQSTKRPGKVRYQQAFRTLQQACAKGDPQHARDALLKWAALHWPDAPLLNLSDLQQLVADPFLKKQIALLSQILYKKEDKTLWRGDELLRALRAMSPNKTARKRSKKGLPPINPEG